MKYKFWGGNVYDVVIRYEDTSYDIYTETSTSVWKTVIYNLDDYKVVDYVRFFNHEWWAPGKLQVNYMAVTYT